jgi:2-polyprenyl-3-methyl-5-hydroxy-6-metoxy-1,4-benzoquinol methylase
MTKREFAKRLPVFSRLVRTIDALRKQNAELQSVLHQLITVDLAATIDRDGSQSPLAGGIPVPPAALRHLVSWTDDLSVFLELGRAGADWLTGILARHNPPVAGSPIRILDFGCGCGRVLRHLRSLPDADLHGCDCNALAVRWCQTHMPFAHFQTNGFAPPLSAENDRFDMIYACSVFTHLPETAQRQWLAEFQRVLAPKGILVITTHGEQFFDRLSRAEQQRFRAGELILRESAYPGANVCAAFHPEAFVRSVLARGFDLLEAMPSIATPPQDAYVLRVKK